MDNINLFLKVQCPIKFQDVCIIYQPSFNEILDYGVDEFEKLLLPYYVSIDNLSDETLESEIEGLTNFDLLSNMPELVDCLFASLEFFCKSKLDVDEQGIIFGGFNGRLNKYNFDEFADIVLKICYREKPKKEKIPVFKNDRQRDIWEKLQEGRRRNAKNNETKIEDIINYCEYGGDSYIPIEEIKKWSLWRIMNCYISKIGMSNYKDNFGIFLVEGKAERIDGKHWTELLKLNYKYKD